MNWLHLIFLIGLVACGKEHDSQKPKDNPRLEELRQRDKEAKTEAIALRNPANGWLVEDCDGMLWTGKYAAVTGVDGVNIGAAEREPGKFARRPEGCTSVNPEWSDWSRDMGTGLVTYAWAKKDLALLERHVAYGIAHKALANAIPVWRMGEPVGNGRGLYPPAFIGRVYQTQFALGGPESVERLWPDLYSKGLTDFQAHLQVMNIWHRGEVAEALRTGTGQATPGVKDDAGTTTPGEQNLLDVSDTMLNVLHAQAARDPRDPLFQAVLGVYTGDMDKAIDALLAPDWYAGEYVRCDDFRKCQLAAWLFAADVVLRRYGE